MGLQLLGTAAIDTSALEARIADVKAMAEAADDKAANARQMVLNRDPRLTAVEQTAASVPLTLQQAAADHAQFRT